ncbi:MAG: hypothetical protein CMJ78_17250 [Planctomycetaceae bacterium]|nr:hypothetical protein [Planctomycetaceae bacterium]
MPRRFCLAATLSLLMVSVVCGETVSWKLTGSEINGSAGSAADDFGGTPWKFLRTTNSKGPVASRTWIRDGKYVPLEQLSARMFDLPLAGAIFQTKPTSKAPFVAGVQDSYTIDCTFKKGEVMLAPGPDHAVVLAWRSPVDGQLSMKGMFNNRQSCCGVNSQVNWYVERGPAPNANGFKPKTLAKGVSNLEVEKGISPFEFNDLVVREGDYFYFIVDAKADGTGSPHHGDGTAFEVTITIKGAKLPPPPTFEKDIAPILASYCHDCHGKDTKEAGLDLRTASAMVYGGESGSALRPGDIDQSYLWAMIQSGEMPPEDSEPLSEKSKSLIRRWIASGAPSNEDLSKIEPRKFVTDKDREHWAFQLPRRQTLPTIEANDLANSPIDVLLLKRLEDKGLTFSRKASKRALIRRLFFDLVGLPPTQDEIEAFITDESPNAYERLVDRLLASPNYGERWGRHWMDTVGYVDVRLYDGDATTIYPNEGMWRYRDYIIQSFNADNPYDLFIREQLAGDEMVDWRNAKDWTPEIMEKVVATGYLRNIEDHTSEAQYGIGRRYEMMFDLMSMVSTSLLGMTFECARCHNHKFDPITQRDYYSLLSYFETSYNAHNWLKPQQRWIPDVGPIARAEIDRHNTEVDGNVKSLNAKIAELQKAGDKADKQQIEKLKADAVRLQSTKRSYGKIQALFNVDNPPVSRVFRRGDCHKLGIPVAHRVPEVLMVTRRTGTPARPNETNSGRAGVPVLREVGSEADRTSQAGSLRHGRRLELARWITSRENPITARVIMNRLWMHHFGKPIVATPGNFGRQGAKPTHPEILGWLALEFQDHDWSLKHVHRLVLTSRAYQQSSRRPQGESRAEQLDPDNQLLWRQNLRRLESEIIRDSILAVSGRLDRNSFGPPVSVSKPVSGLSMVETNGGGHNRRSVYVFARRVYPLKFMEIFDSPIMAVNCTRRMNSTNVLQSFAQLNSNFVVGASRDAAQRISQDNEKPVAFVDAAYRTIIGRGPSQDEQAACLEFLVEQAAAYRGEAQPNELAFADLCHMLLCTNEFLYIE